MEKISVIIPVYNVEKYIEECVESVICQTYPLIEIILIDDGSTDRCPDICDAYAEQDGRVQVVHKENGGLSDARNAGLDIAQGEYIVFVDSDDYIAPDMIEKLYKKAKERDADMVLCRFAVIDEKGKAIPEKTEAEETGAEKTEAEKTEAEETEAEKTEAGKTGPEKLGQRDGSIWPEDRFWDRYYSGDTVFCVVAWNKIYKRDVFEGIRYDVGRYHEDEFMLNKLVKRCGFVDMLGETLYFYRQRTGSIMNRQETGRHLDRIEAWLIRCRYAVGEKKYRLAEQTLFLVFDELLLLCGQAGMEHACDTERYRMLKRTFKKEYLSFYSARFWRGCPVKMFLFLVHEDLYFGIRDIFHFCKKRKRSANHSCEK